MTLIVILLIAGFILVGAEVLLPGGVLGIIALGVFIGAISLAAVDFGSSAALAVFAVTLIGSCITFFSMFKYIAISKSGAGLRLDAAVDGNASGSPIDPALIGQSGTTATKLVPDGLVSVGDQNLQAHSEDGFIDVGAAVKIHGIRNGNIVVRKAV